MIFTSSVSSGLDHDSANKSVTVISNHGGNTQMYVKRHVHCNAPNDTVFT